MYHVCLFAPPYPSPFSSFFSQLAISKSAPHMSLVLLNISLSQASFSLSLLIVGVRPWVSAMHLETILSVTTTI